jgi:HK97 gp10 family phage protein
MPDEVMKISGLDEMQAKLKTLQGKVVNSYVRKSLRAGANVTLLKARGLAPVRTGLIRRSIKVKAGRAPKGIITVRVSLGAKMKNFYGAWVDEGHFTGKRLRGKFGKGAEGKKNYHHASAAAGRKFIRGLHFMEMAYESTKSQAVKVIADTMKGLVNSGA